MVREVRGQQIAIDFLVEGPVGGGRMVDDVRASSFQGIQRALDSKITMPIAGEDAFGVRQEFLIPVASLGSLMVLKLNAFYNRRHPKDAFDLMTLAMVHPTLAAKALEQEADTHNPGYSIARECLESFFLKAEADGPRRALAFRDGDESLHSLSDESRRTLEQMATMGRFQCAEDPRKVQLPSASPCGR